MNKILNDKVKHETIREKVVEILRRMILRGQLKPGERIVEQEIADELGVSRVPVRESLIFLEREGLVNCIRNKGTYIRKFTNEDIKEVFYIRASLEKISVEYCRGVISKDKLEELEECLSLIKKDMENNSIYEFVEHDELFHGKIVKACGLKKLYDLWNGLNSVNIALFLGDSRDNFNLNNQYKRHKLLLDVLKKQNIEESKKAIEEHYFNNTALNDHLKIEF